MELGQEAKSNVGLRMMKSPPLFLLKMGKVYLSRTKDLGDEGWIGMRRWGERECESLSVRTELPHRCRKCSRSLHTVGISINRIQGHLGID